MAHDDPLGSPFEHDPTFLMRDMVVFSILAVIIFFGYFYVRRNTQVSGDRGGTS